MSLLRRADRVKVACLAQLVNVIAPIRTEPGGAAWRQATFHPFALTSAHARGTVLRVEPAGPSYDTVEHGEVPLLDAVAVARDDGDLVLLMVNRHETDQLVAAIDLRGLPGLHRGTHLAVHDDDPTAVNGAGHTDRVVPRGRDDVKVEDGRVEVALPALSWNLVRLRPGE
jgi:alpha-N-arabinofuranosidase